MRSHSIGAFLAAVLFVLLVAAPSAWAGIIVTEGRIADTGTPNAALGTCGDLDDPDALADGECDEGDTSTDPLTDLESDPMGWNCTHLALGIEYCEPDSSGPDKGVRPSSGKDKHHGAEHGEDGYSCSGGSSPLQAAPAAFALLMLIGLARRRREA